MQQQGAASCWRLLQEVDQPTNQLASQRRHREAQYRQRDGYSTNALSKAAGRKEMGSTGVTGIWEGVEATVGGGYRRRRQRQQSAAQLDSAMTLCLLRGSGFCCSCRRMAKREKGLVAVVVGGQPAAL